MKASEIYDRLRELAPSIVFSASREYDESEVWDGDGPDPQEDGFIPYVVTIKALTIHVGRMIEGAAYLSSCYFADGEMIDDIHGYLPQMLDEAVDELIEQLPDGLDAKTQALGVVAFLKAEMTNRYNEQRSRIESS